MKCFGRPSRRVVTVSFLLSMLIGWQVDAIGAQLNLTRLDSSADKAGFAIERSTGTTGAFAEITRTGSGVTTYTDSSVAAATTYCYRVRAFTAVAYSAYSNLACSTIAQSFGLSVVKFGLGNGTVTSSPAGINCGTSCAGTYASGTTVTFTATPATGSSFTGWSGGGCTGTGTCTVTVTAATTLAATFAPQSATALSVTPQSLTFTKTLGQPNPPAQTVTVTAAAGQVWTTHDTMPFANVSGLPFNGSDGVNGIGPDTFQVVPSSGMTALAVGVYTGSITVSTAGVPNLVIPVQVIVSSSSLGLSTTISVNSTTVTAGGSVTATWSGIASPTATDWIGLYAHGAADTAYRTWIYVSCSKTAGSAVAGGACALAIPGTAAAGTYELRLYSKNGFTKLATSNALTVTAGLSVSPTAAVTAGESVTATWSGIASPTTTDWIGLYAPGAADTAYLTWIYVSCSKSAGGAAPGGACAFAIPSTVAAGTYELRLFSNNGFTKLAISNALTVN